MIAIIGGVKSECIIIWSLNKIAATRNMKIAKGRVSKRGAFELTSPSLFRPCLRFTKEPVISPNIQANPRVNPSTNAALHSFPIQNQFVGSEINNGSMKGRSEEGVFPSQM